ncbi:MAG: DUF3332 family protein [Planctomycetota bacterium]|nr:DUF3332 family protein [Planctomycetota bacterium]
MSKRLAAVALGLAVSLTSCIGPNKLANSVLSWNSTVTESKFANELIFLGLHFVPVYQIAYAADGLILNSIEFWGGENPVAKPAEFTPQADK